jgi:hypothetical protein
LHQPIIDPSPTPPAGSARGAPFGRPSASRNEISAPPQQFYLTKIRINAGGYDPGGAYWGVGQPLYYFTTEDGAESGYLRASDRDHAKDKVRQLHPGARFFR